MCRMGWKGGTRQNKGQCEGTVSRNGEGLQSMESGESERIRITD